MKMDEYIRKDKAIDIFIEGDGDNEFTEGYNFAVNEYREKIKAMPAADVKHGRWELTNNPSFRKCSECGAWWSSDITDNCFTNYCPKCGARMIKDGDTE